MAFWGTVIAVLGTLAGTALASVTQHLVTRRGEQREHRQEVAARVSEVLAAALACRERFWLRGASARDGKPETAEERAGRYAARSAVTQAMDRLAMTTAHPRLLAAAAEAAWSAIGLSETELGLSETALDAGRTRSRDAHTALRDTGAAYIHRR
ncbi:hypothetical protein RM780_27215 [Streptomyces sp. DSM 44917]|uniref:Protein kilB n=1 Tax=Streptomyces boetiae TaxID=3075541 RepID=A0ABU2LG98_9ACTN|nr:hypothetical protein [Streptomyces sp. DSM 44917]MDT0310609.1 hypothetical protein [Streptomyces sp. DSM 44917]